VAAWVRHAAGEVCRDWPFPEYAAFVHGHDAHGNQTKGERADDRFMYLPLPTINHALNRVESIRRVLIAAPCGYTDRIDWIRRRLPGQELVWGSEVIGLINLLPTSDWVLNQYLGPKEGSRTWSTVTPVVWPGYDDRDAAKAERILRKAFVDAGIARELVDGITELAWRPVGFRAGVELASRYALPDRLKGQRYHVRVCFPHPVRGPLAVGAGRYRGLGLFAAENE
jgi:CRISPR-associated protein Csb2